MQLLHGDCRDVLKTIPDESVQTVVTSPPYWRMRRYTDDPREIGQEATIAEYVQALAGVFAECWRVLRADGVLFLNLGDGYAGSSMTGGTSSKEGSAKRSGRMFGTTGRVVPNLCNCLQSSIERRVFTLSGRYTLTISTKSGDVLDAHHLTPDSKLTRLFGVKRIFIEQGNDDLCQVFDLLDSEGCLWVSSSTSFIRVGPSHSDIILDARNHISIIVSEHDLDCQAALSIDTLKTTEHAKVSFAVEESSKPIPESIGDIQSIRDAVALNSTGESFLQVDLVDDLVASGKRLAAASKGLRDFRVTKASQEHFSLSVLQGCFDLAVSCVGHFFVSNEYGSFIRYTELYDKAYRMSNSLKSKQLIGMPWMVARALQEYGWILRAEVVWE